MIWLGQKLVSRKKRSETKLSLKQLKNKWSSLTAWGPNNACIWVWSWHWSFSCIWKFRTAVKSPRSAQERSITNTQHELNWQLAGWIHASMSKWKEGSKKESTQAVKRRFVFSLSPIKQPVQDSTAARSESWVIIDKSSFFFPHKRMKNNEVRCRDMFQPLPPQKHHLTCWFTELLYIFKRKKMTWLSKVESFLSNYWLLDYFLFFSSDLLTYFEMTCMTENLRNLNSGEWFGKNYRAFNI